MRKWIICIFVCLVGFLVIADGKVKAQECGSEGEVCCQENNQWKCDSDNLMCVQYGNDFQCVPKPSDSSLIGTCKCRAPITHYQRINCYSMDNHNYCDASKGEQAFCRVVGPGNNQCGYYDLGEGLFDSCKCKTQEEASQDPELNGELKKYKPDTCTFGKIGNFYSPKYYYEFNYCDGEKIPKMFFCTTGSVLYPRCICVDKNLHKDTIVQSCYQMEDRYIVDKPVTGGESEPDTKFLYGTDYKLYCEDKGDDENPYIQTSLGCIPVTVKGFVAWLLPILFSIAGTVAFLIMVGGFIALATSEGDPKKIQAARETITAAVTGLLISIFSIFIVRLIIVYILKIPGA